MALIQNPFVTDAAGYLFLVKVFQESLGVFAAGLE